MSTSAVKTGDGVTLHEHVCGKCNQIKMCLPGLRTVGDGHAEEIYSCPGCLDRERDEYLARLA